MRNLLILTAVLLSLAACRKFPGEGGQASIEGSVRIENRLVLTNPSTVFDTVPGADEEVFLVYGDHISPDDRLWTDYEGNFRFRNLRKGSYTLYVYSKDTTGNPGENNLRMPIIREIEVTERKEEIDLGDLFIYDDEI